jgi:two-component system, cell cycle sensor histidine kinase and response regulator CckA
MKILAVDNDHLMLKFYARILDKCGQEFKTAKDGLSALEIMKSFIPDVVLLDLVMPNIDGKKLCKIIRSSPHLRNTKVVFVSAVAREEQSGLEEYGADGLIAKGTFSSMESHIIETIGLLSEGHNLKNNDRVKGIEDQHARAITKELIYSRRHFETILQNMSEGILEFAPNFNIVYANPAAVSLTGVSEEKLLGSDLLDLFPLPNRKDIKQNIETAIAQGFNYQEDAPLEINGNSCYLSILPVVDNSTATTIAILKDITTRMKIVERLQHVMKMESLGTLAGGIAHDFNNLMMGVQGNLSVLLLDVNYTHPHYEIIKRIEKVVKSASRLTGQLLGYARKGKYEPQIMDLNQILVDSSEMFGRTKKNIVIERDLAEDLYNVEIDRGQIEQVLINLFLNSMQAMPDGGKLKLRTSNATHLDIQNHFYNPVKGQYALMEITDTGIGIDPKVQKRIFDPFFSTKEYGSGSGLGLASTYGIIKNHNGYIEVDSEKGRGATFKIFLPAASRRLPPKAKTITAKPKKELILLVDDEEMILDSGEKMLRILDYEVIVAGDGETALGIFRSRREEIDLVILDMVMPGMNGADVYNKLKETDPNVRVLISSGYSMDGLPEGFGVHDSERFLQKPFDLKTLFKKTRELLD